MNSPGETDPNFRWRSERARGGGGRFLRTPEMGIPIETGGDCFPVAFGFEMMRFRTAAGNLMGGLSSFANGCFVPRSEVIGPAMWATGEVGLQLAVPGAQAAGDLRGGMFPMIQPPIAKAPS